jgi:putative transposase
VDLVLPYTIIDIYSRYVPGWLLARAERAQLAERLLADTIAKQAVARQQLMIHADRGASMASRPVALLLADLGVTKSHSRPHCSNDNPYSEAQFKTLKYRPESPDPLRRVSPKVRSIKLEIVGTQVTNRVWVLLDVVGIT